MHIQLCQRIFLDIQKTGKEISLNSLWNRRQCTKFNGVPYVTQKGAEAIYTKEGQEQIKKNIEYYRRNAKIIKEGLEKAGYEVYGGVNAPYIWLKVPKGYTSWEFFDFLLEEKNVVRNSRSRIWKCRRRIF